MIQCKKTRKNINITYSLGIDSQEARKKLITFIEYYFRTSVFWDMMPEEVSQSNARLRVWEQIKRAGGHLSLDQNLDTEYRRIEFIRKSAPYSMPRGKCYTSAEINIVGDAIYDRASGAILVQLPQYDALQNSLGGGGIFTTNEHEILQTAMTLFYVSFRGFCNVFFLEQSLKDLEPLKALRQICSPIGGDPLAARKWCHDRLVEKVSKIVSGRHFLSNEENKVKDPIKFARLLTQLFHLFCMSGKTSMKSERPFEVRFGGLIQKMFSQAQVAYVCENERIVSKCGTVSKMDEIPIHVCYKSLKIAGFVDCVKLPTATQITLSVQAFMKKLTAIGQNGITDFLRGYVLIGLTESSVGLTRIEYFRRAGLTDSQVIAQVDPNYFKFANS